MPIMRAQVHDTNGCEDNPGNLAVLKNDEWNVLVRSIHSGQLGEL